MKRAWQSAAAIVVLWLVGYAVFWLHHSGCFDAFTRACLDAPYEPIRSFVMLDWVWDYQTLTGAVLAVIAGAGVVWSTWAQRQWALEDIRIGRAERTLNALTQVRLAFQNIFNAILSSVSMESVRQTGWEQARRERILRMIDRADDAIAGAAELGNIAEMLQYAASEVGDRVRIAPPTLLPNELAIAAAIAGAVGGYLQDGGRFIGPSGRADHKVATTTEYLTSMTNGLKITVEELRREFPGIDAMFDFD